jgi:hypothetical protein
VRITLDGSRYDGRRVSTYFIGCLRRI